MIQLIILILQTVSRYTARHPKVGSRIAVYENEIEVANGFVVKHVLGNAGEVISYRICGMRRNLPIGGSIPTGDEPFVPSHEILISSKRTYSRRIEILNGYFSNSRAACPHQ